MAILNQQIERATASRDISKGRPKALTVHELRRVTSPNFWVVLLCVGLHNIRGLIMKSCSMFQWRTVQYYCAANNDRLLILRERFEVKPENVSVEKHCPTKNRRRTTACSCSDCQSWNVDVHGWTKDIWIWTICYTARVVYTTGVTSDIDAMRCSVQVASIASAFS